MPITSIAIDPAAATMTATARVAVPVRRLWDAYVDPRCIERFWGPPTWPARFTRHDGFPGGVSSYAMTSPDGEQARGYWDWVAVDPTVSFEVRDGFAGPDGAPDPALPSMRMRFAFEADGEGSLVRATTSFPSASDMQDLLAMGMAEGTREAMGQLGAVLATPVPDRPARAEVLDERRVRVSRLLAAAPDQVWRAHHEPDLLQQWLLGPGGWQMPVCEVADGVGERYRYEWQTDAGQHRFGFTGCLLESRAPFRSVTTEQLIGAEGEATRNELTLTGLAGGTLLCVVITYPDAALRDMVLGTGLAEGMESSYARLETLLAQ